MSPDRITARASRVLIVATGPSVEALDPARIEAAMAAGVYVLAVNGAVDWLPAAHGWFTLDPSPVNVYRARRRRLDCAYIMAVPPGFGTEKAEKPEHRIKAPAGVTYLRRAIADGISTDPRRINSGNSAWGALQVACLMGARRVALLGVDANHANYAHTPGAAGPVGTLGHLPLLFEAARPQLLAADVDVVNGSPESNVWCFPRMTPGEAVDWLLEGSTPAGETAPEDENSYGEIYATREDEMAAFDALPRMLRDMLNDTLRPVLAVEARIWLDKGYRPRQVADIIEGSVRDWLKRDRLARHRAELERAA